MVRKGRAVARLDPAPSEAPAPATGPRIRRREAWLPLAGAGAEAYPGFEVQVWTNYPARLWADVQSRDEERIGAALRQLIRGHNGWQDFDGQPYPPADTAEFWGAIPTELAALIILTIERGAFDLPNSIRGSATR